MSKVHSHELEQARAATTPVARQALELSSMPRTSPALAASRVRSTLAAGLHPRSHEVMTLQRSLGNRGTSQLLASTSAPRSPGDRDALSEGRSSAPLVQRALAGAPRDPDTGASTAWIHETAQRGVRGAGDPLPHLPAIQRAFGKHDVRDVRAHLDAEAGAASRSIGAQAYTTGRHVAFAHAAPSLRLVAHEAAHVVQQRGGVRLKGGVGEHGDPCERHADAVADAVASGLSAERLLDLGAGLPRASAAAAGAPVQRYITTDEGRTMLNETVKRQLVQSGIQERVAATMIQKYGGRGTAKKYAEVLDEARLLPKVPQVLLEEIPRGKIEDVVQFINAAQALDIPAKGTAKPECERVIFYDKLDALTNENRRKIPLLYRGYMGLTKAARDAVLNGESLSGMARTEKEGDATYDLAAGRQQAEDDYVPRDPSENWGKFKKLKGAVASHKGPGTGTSNFVGTSAGHDTPLTWFKPSPRPFEETYSIAIVVVPEETDIIFKSVEWLEKGGTGTSVDQATGKITDLEEEYLFGGGFSADRIVAYVSLKYNPMFARKKPTAGDV